MASVFQGRNREKESRTVDAAVLKKQVHQMLHEWKAELNEPSPASSLQQGGGFGSFSTDICRLLQLCDDEDDVTSPSAAPKPEPRDPSLQPQGDMIFQEGQPLCDFPLVDERMHPTSGVHNVTIDNLEGAILEYHQFDLHQDFDRGFYAGPNGITFYEKDAMPHISSYRPSICLPPSAFLGPKCALWDFPRPAQGLDWCQDYHWNPISYSYNWYRYMKETHRNSDRDKTRSFSGNQSRT